MINKVILLGRISKKEIRKDNNEKEFIALTIVTIKKWKNAQGLMQEESIWHKIHCFAKIYEIAKKNSRVNDMVYVEGEINCQRKEIGNGEFANNYVINCYDLRIIPGQNKQALDGNILEPNGNVEE